MNRAGIWSFAVALLLGGSFGFNSSAWAEAEALAEAPAAIVDVGNTVCPISGRRVDPGATVVYKGKRYALCCKNCVEQFNENPEKFAAKLDPSSCAGSAAGCGQSV